MEGAGLGAHLSNLLLNMPQLQRLDCNYSNLRAEGARALQPALQKNRTLIELNLSQCQLGDEGIRIIADALVGNTTLEVMGFYNNGITSVGLADITRLLETTQLKTIILWGHLGVFDDEDATQHFLSTLQHKNSSVQELTEINPEDFREDEDSQIATFAKLASIYNSLARNKQLNRVNLLLAPLTLQQHHEPPTGTSSTTMWIKTCHKAIAKFAKVHNNAGASAIFKLFQNRPALLEKRLKRPAPTGFRQHDDSSSSSQINGNDKNHGGTATRTIGGQKRRRS